MVQCRLIRNGTIAEGTGFGFKKTVYGEVVFNTGMAGYQENLTDPSYRGQILIMSHPVIGNYGVNDRFTESSRSRSPDVWSGDCRQVSRCTADMTWIHISKPIRRQVYPD